ncbi:MAG TPA: YadA-like family protein, partial [Xanthomonadaceae bacterium]|nr:YadA-like family protein [Xanthomonadaceae bacterium]
GSKAQALGVSGSAIGANSVVTADANNAVALGAGSVADQANTISVGDVGSERRIVNVAAGTSANDAVNLAQMQAGDATTLAATNAFTTNQVGALQTRVDTEFTVQDRRISRIGAMGAAFSGMAMNTAGLAGENRVGVGFGSLSGQQAISVGYQRAFNNNHASVSVGGAFSSSDSSINAGAGFSW